MKSPIAAAAAALTLVSSAAPAIAAPDYQVVRAGDNEASCEVLLSEINSLNAEVQRQQEQAERNAKSRQTAGRLGRGLLSGLARSATSFAYGSTSTDAMAGIVAANAASGVANEIASGGGNAQPAPQVEPVNTPQKQRLDHLQSISAVRPC